MAGAGAGGWTAGGWTSGTVSAGRRIQAGGRGAAGVIGGITAGGVACGRPGSVGPSGPWAPGPVSALASSAARSLKQTGSVSRVRPSVVPVPMRTLSWQTSVPGSPAGSAKLTVTVPALGGATVIDASAGMEWPPTLRQVTISRSPVGHSPGSQATLTDIGSPDGPSPTTGPPDGPRAPKVDPQTAAGDAGSGPAPAPADVSGTSPAASTPSVT